MEFMAKKVKIIKNKFIFGKYNYLQFIFVIIISLGLYSCIDTPVDTPPDIISDTSSGAFILCEGLKGYDNSSLTRVSLPDLQVEKNSYDLRNKNDRLGDTANDILLIGDTAYVAVSLSNRIEIFLVSSGINIGSIQLSENSNPRYFAYVNSEKIYFSNLRDNSISSFNPKTFDIIDERIECGPFPEDIKYNNGKIFTANSALGYFYKDHPQAATISVIDEQSGNILDYLYCGQNVQEIIISEKHNKMFGVYYNTYEKDSIGGLVIYDLNSFEELQRFEMNITDATLGKDEDRLYFFKQTPKGVEEKNWRGLSYLDLTTGEIIDFIENPQKSEFWYALAEYKDEIWVANAKNFQTNGEIIIFDRSGNELNRFETGINPNNIRFFK